jgi:hypothetical protein
LHVMDKNQFKNHLEQYRNHLVNEENRRNTDMKDSDSYRSCAYCGAAHHGELSFNVRVLLKCSRCKVPRVRRYFKIIAIFFLVGSVLLQ